MYQLNDNSDVFEIIRRKLGLSDRANVIKEYGLAGSAFKYRPDVIIEDKNKRYYIELKSKTDIDTIARLYLFKEYLKKSGSSKDDYFVIASKVIPPAEEEIAKKFDIKLIEIPPHLKLYDTEFKKPGSKIKLTSPKAWKVIAALLKEKITSIRQLSIKENVSYGWAYKTVHTLMDQGIITRKDDLVYVNDINKLLNGIAWERPFENLFAGEINVDYTSAHLAAIDISHVLKKQGIKFAFTGYTAGGLYTGYAIRYDTVYLYIDKEKIDLFKDEIASKDKTGIKVRLYSPDRDVFSHSREKESITITSPDQTLLDLSGLGYSGMDITKVLVEKYATL